MRTALVFRLASFVGCTLAFTATTPAFAQLGTSGHGDAQNIEASAEPSAPQAETYAFVRDPLEDQMDFVLSYAARCPAREDFVNQAMRSMRQHRTDTKVNALPANVDSCLDMDMSRLGSFRHMSDMQKTYKRLQIENADSRRPLESIMRALRTSCVESFEDGTKPDTLGLLYDLTCSGATPPEDDQFTGEDWVTAYHDTSHAQHGAVQKQIDRYAKEYGPINSKGWNEEYDRALMQKLMQSPLVHTPSPAMMKDLVGLCPGFGAAPPEDRARVWTAVFDAMSMAESAHKPTTTYLESFGPTSTGMLQISYASAQGHASMCRRSSGRAPCGCSGATTAGLKQPVFNLECGVTIMENQMINAQRGLFGSKSYYWSVLNTRLNGFPKVMGRLKAVKQDPRRWPPSCGG